MSSIIAELYSGATRVLIVDGTPLEHLNEGLYAGANAKGVMGAGLAAEIRRLGGPDIERELRGQGPLLLGNAYLTAPGDLGERGVKAIAHGVVVAEPGASATLATSINGLLSGLHLLDEAGCRSVTIPQIGWRVANLDQEALATELSRVVATHLRRKTRIGLISIVSSQRDYLTAVAAAFSALTAPYLEREASSGF